VACSLPVLLPRVTENEQLDPLLTCLLECGMHFLEPTSLEPPLAALHLPPIAASPDGRILSTGYVRAVFEVKCPFPFRDVNQGCYDFNGCKQYGVLLTSSHSARCVQLVCMSAVGHT
jgi:hypothetical protein